MTALIAEEYDGVWHKYGPAEIYIFSIYWIFEVLTTVGYGDYIIHSISDCGSIEKS